MLNRKIASAAIVIGLMGLARLATAQNSQDEFRPFNGLFADLFDDGSQPKPKQVPPPAATYNYSGPATTQLQRTPTRAPQQPAPPSDPGLPIPPPPSSGATRSTAPLPAPPTTSSPRVRTSATGNNYSFQYDDAPLPSGPALSPPSPSTSLGSDPPPMSAVPAAPAGVPLHERLKVFRDSPFGDTAQAAPPRRTPRLPPRLPIRLRAGPPQRRRLPSRRRLPQRQPTHNQSARSCRRRPK